MELQRPLTDEAIDVSTISLPSKPISFYMLRLDNIGGPCQGNKIFKLSRMLELAKDRGKSGLLSFGGIHSNHLHALAYTGKQLGFDTVGMVRGYPEQQNTPTLKDCRDQGMKLVFLTREEYALRNDADYLNEVSQKYPSYYVIEEGGYSEEGIQGAALISDHIANIFPDLPDRVALPVGTGATAMGIIDGLIHSDVRFLLFCALNNKEQIEERLEQRYRPEALSRIEVIDDYICGGFAKINAELVDFMDFFESSTGILLDPVYNLKSTYGLYDSLNQEVVPSNETVLLVHTGGLQGRRAMQEKINRLRESR